MTAPDDLGIRLLMARTGISREDATVMWYAKDLLAACKRIVREDADGDISIGAIEDCQEAIRKAEG